MTVHRIAVSVIGLIAGLIGSMLIAEAAGRYWESVWAAASVSFSCGVVLLFLGDKLARFAEREGYMERSAHDGRSIFFELALLTFGCVVGFYLILAVGPSSHLTADYLPAVTGGFWIGMTLAGSLARLSKRTKA